MALTVASMQSKRDKEQLKDPNQFKSKKESFSNLKKDECLGTKMDDNNYYKNDKDKSMEEYDVYNQSFPSNSKFPDSCSFSSGCVFGSNCTFGGNTKFGKYCRFGSNCYFGDGCTFGLNAQFGIGCVFGKVEFQKGCQFGIQSQTY